jgi:hypothetical protein
MMTGQPGGESLAFKAKSGSLFVNGWRPPKQLFSGAPKLGLLRALATCSARMIRAAVGPVQWVLPAVLACAALHSWQG